MCRSRLLQQPGVIFDFSPPPLSACCQAVLVLMLVLMRLLFLLSGLPPTSSLELTCSFPVEILSVTHSCLVKMCSSCRARGTSSVSLDHVTVLMMDSSGHLLWPSSHQRSKFLITGCRAVSETGIL